MKKYLTPLLFSVGVLAVILLVILALRSPEKTPSEQDSDSAVASEKQLEQLRSGNAQGPEDAKVVLSEFGDYQCPACASVHPVLKDTILPQYEGKIRFVFKNFPLVDIHKNAQASAQAAEAAAAQGKFWQMHDILYEKQNEWANLGDPIDKFGEYASSIGIDADRLKREVREEKYAKIIKDDVSLGNDLKVGSTPTFFINGQQIDISEGGIGALSSAIDQALAN